MLLALGRIAGHGLSLHFTFVHESLRCFGGNQPSFLIILLFLLSGSPTVVCRIGVVVASFSMASVVQVVTILASPMANIGAIRSTAIPLLREVLDPLSSTLLNSLAAPTNTDDLGSFR